MTLPADLHSLRARCQAAESALRWLLHAAEDMFSLPGTIGHYETARLLAAVSAINAGLPEPPEVVCTQCHRPLVVAQELDHIETDTGWVCMPCAERSGDAVAWAPSQGGDLPQTPR